MFPGIARKRNFQIGTSLVQEQLRGASSSFSTGAMAGLRTVTAGGRAATICSLTVGGWARTSI